MATIAFITARGTEPAVGGVYPLDGANSFYLDKITEFRKAGGDIIMSFGGAAGAEMGNVVQEIATLVKIYQEVINIYSLKYIDLDIEGSLIADTAAVDRRNQALKIIKKNNPSLNISYTLPTNPTGLDNNGEYVLASAAKYAFQFDVLNLMQMDYSVPTTPGQMAAFAIQSAKAGKAQLEKYGLKATIGCCPMIGVNDTPGEVFSLDDAKTLVAFANKNTWISRLAFWSLGRDQNPSGNTAVSASSVSSGVIQDPFAFTKIFNA